MPTNRLRRDDILSQALDMVDSSAVDEKCRPGGVFPANAMCIGWLQTALDLFHRAFPWKGTTTSTAITLTAAAGSLTAPTDFVLDMRDGLVISHADPETRVRLRRASQTDLVDYDVAHGTGTTTYTVPRWYVVRDDVFTVRPIPDRAYTGTLWYYKLPVALAPNGIPAFPDDWTLVEYVRLRGKEWIGEVPAGAAMEYANGVIGKLQSAGLGPEAENQRLDLDPTMFHRSGATSGNAWDWLGSTVIRS